MSELDKKSGLQVKSGVRGGMAYERPQVPGVMTDGMWSDDSGNLLFPDVSMSIAGDENFTKGAYGAVLDGNGNVAGTFQYKQGPNTFAWTIAYATGNVVSGNSRLGAANDDRTWAIATNYATGFYSA